MMKKRKDKRKKRRKERKEGKKEEVGASVSTSSILEAGVMGLSSEQNYIWDGGLSQDTK